MLLSRIKIFILVLILFLGFWLRFQNLAVWPRHGATFDEFAWTWLGINLIEKRVPVSWSRHPQYKETKLIIYQGAAFQLVKPYLEHPPLFGLVAGGFAKLNDVSNMYQVTLAKIRPLALILGVFSILMVFLLVWELYGLNLGFLAALLYATIPTVVVGSRLVQNENFLIPFWLVSLYFTAKYLRTKKRWLRNAAIVTAGLLPLAKVPWLVAPFSLAMIFAYQKKWKDALMTVIVTIFFFSFFILYGFYFDKEVFLGLWLLQLSRYDMSFVGFFSLFTKPLLIDRAYLDGWIYFGFISLFLLVRDFKKHIFILFPFLAYFLVFIFAIPDEAGHGWYRYPFYPFLIISIALFLKEFLFKNQILTFLFFSFVGLTLLQLTWVPVFGFSYSVLRTAILGFSLVLLPLFFESKKLVGGIKLWSYFLFILLILFNIWAVYLYNEN